MARYLSANTQTAEDLLSLDVDNIHCLGDSYNKRYPDRNLRYMGSPAKFLEALIDRSSDSAWRAVVRLADSEMADLGTDPKWAFIGVGAQKSAGDCLICSMQFALAARQKSSTFDD
ncbi:hypothetical protein ACE103_08675 [Bradyrhizobium sp. ma5]|uniref:YopJ family acetyltransferase n=1 Tax=Bradyrhizobium sp. ma5 TaxID=3344828 RepID=UPI0035D4D499